MQTMEPQTKVSWRSCIPRFLVATAGLSLLVGAASAEERDAGKAPVSTTTLPSSPQLKGVVEVLVQGQTTALGVVLANDGRIATALSSLNTPSSSAAPGLRVKGPIEIRFSDGRKSPARLAHKHETHDLALLIPSLVRFRTGFEASERDPRKELLSFATLGKAGAPVLVGASFGSEKDLRSGAKGWDLYVIPNVMPGWTPGDAGVATVETLSAMLGSPVLDAAGNVIGIATRSGSSSPGPSPAVVDVAQIREFLMQSPRDAVFPPVWLGVSGVSEILPGVELPLDKPTRTKKGVRVQAIAPGGPADKAGLVIAKDPKKNPLILSVNEIAVETPEALAAVISKYSIDDHVFLRLADGTSSRTLEVILEAKPEKPALKK